MHQRFLDPLYGQIAIDERTRKLVFSPEFQRLRYIRLCNINSLYLTGASEPRRFEHCIGVCHLADLWARSRSLPSRQATILKAAALLHDLQTGPFGHSFQYVMEDNPFEQKFEHANLSSGVESGFLQRVEAGAHFAGRLFAVPQLLGEVADEVYSAIRGEGPFGPLISGTLDLDNLDNVVRLAFHMGLVGEADRSLPITLTPLLEPHEGGLGAHGGARPLLERWFEIRKLLYEYLLLDRGEFAAKAMLTLAVELSAKAGLLGPDDWKLTDEQLLDALESRTRGDHQFVSQTIKRLRLGDLFECLDVWQTSQTSAYEHLSDAAAKRELETAIEEAFARCKAPRLRICIHYILDRKKTCRSLEYEDLSTGRRETVGYDSGVLLIGAFVTNSRATELSEAERRRLSDLARGVLADTGLLDLNIAPEPLAEVQSEVGLFAA